MLGSIVLCKTGDKLGIILHMTICYMNENSCIKIFHTVSEQYRILRDFLDVDSCYKHLVTSLPNLGQAIMKTVLDLGLGQGGGRGVYGGCRQAFIFQDLR